MNVPFGEVFKHLGANKTARAYPDRHDLRCADGLLWPTCQPSFRIDPASKPAVFTIGSCFARNIEEALLPLGFELPTRDLITPPVERGRLRPNAVLNEFNPGTMQQRILYALTSREFDDETLVPAAGGLVADLLLVHGVDVSLERARERRREIARVYQRLLASQYVIITLGLVESWFDNHARIYLNRMPPVPVMKANPDRYAVRTLDAAECFELLEPAIRALVDHRLKVILTVSPVPLHATMQLADAVVANEASKAALRVCVDRLSRQFHHMDYFPSYEIVRSGGLASYEDDNLHVKSQVVHRITGFMVQAYCRPADLARSA